MKCECGFKFAGAGEFRNAEIIITSQGKLMICPKCGQTYKSKE